MRNPTNSEVINHDALKYFRKKSKMTQEQLAKKLGCTKDQVNRWENGKTQKPRKRVHDKLAAALGVTWGDLTRDPPPPENEGLFPKIQLRYSVDPSTRTALELVSRIFAVRPAAIIEIAPLLFFITASKSLADRKKNIDNVKEQLEHIIDDSQSAAPHLAPAFNYLGVGDVNEAIDIERQSIEHRELFGPWDDYEAYGEIDEIEKNNPYSNYIESLLEKLPNGWGWIDKEEFGSPLYNKDVPRFRISMSILCQVVGISGDTENDQEILRFISNGDIDIKKLLKDKGNLSEADYLESLSKKYEVAKSERETRFPSFDLDLSCLIPSEKENKS